MSGKEQLVEWVGGRFMLPARIKSMGEQRAEMTLWIELPDLQIVGQTLEDPRDRQVSFSQALVRATSSPLFGKPRRPDRVRVADVSLAAQLQTLSFVDVLVAPTPELDKVARAVGAFFGASSYFSDPELTTNEVEGFFAAARQLWTARPWTLIADDALIQVAAPKLGIEDGCISVVGAAQKIRGFVFFPSYDDYRSMSDSEYEGETTNPHPTHSALYFSYDAHDDVPEGMRKEIAEYGWTVAEPSAHPVLLRMLNGKPAPVLRQDLELVTALSKALASFVHEHAEDFANYEEADAHASYGERGGLQIELRIPHPDVLEDEQLWQPPRAPTCSEQLAAYDLPLEASELSDLAKKLGSFTVHRVLGLLCAVASVPQTPPPSFWLGEIMQHLKLGKQAQAASMLEPVMALHGHVVATLEDGSLAGLVPEAADVEACREWALGYTSLLARLDPASIPDHALDAGLAIQTLAEVPEMLTLLDEMRGTDSREVWMTRYRESLADDADYLLDFWTEARAHPPSPPPPTRREATKVGRNDPCPCGSGKKHKKCCALQ